MATLDEIVGTKPVTLDDVVPQEKAPVNKIPEDALKTRAAYSTFLSENPEQFASLYQGIMEENRQGVDYTRLSILDNAKKQNSPADIRVMTNILADPSLNEDQKLKALEAYKRGEQYDPVTLFGVKTAAEPVKNENAEAEEVRMSGAEQWRNVREQRELVQGLRNRHEGMRWQEEHRFFGEFIETALPFATNKLSLQHFRDIAKELNMEVSAGKAFLLPGSVAKDIVDTFERLPIDKKIELTRKIYDKIEGQKGIIFTKDNKFSELQQIDAFLRGDYGTGSKWIDNVATLLDIVGLGGTLRSAVKAVRAAKVAKLDKVPDVVLEGEYIPASKASTRATVDRTSPVSSGKMAIEANPDVSRRLLQTVEDSSGDEAAKAVFGSTKEEALASANNPQIGVVDGSVEPNIVNPSGYIHNVDQDVIDIANDTGALWWTKDEKAAARAHVVIDLETFSGLTVHDNMSTVIEEGGKVKVNATFGNRTGGFLNAKEAFDQVKFSLAEYGVTQDQIQLLKKVNGEYVPVSLKEAENVKGDYLAQVKFDYAYRADEIGNLEAQTVKRNWFDSIPVFRSQKSGTPANHLFDHASMLSKLYTGAAVTQADKAVRLDKALLKLHSAFSDIYVKLPKDRQAKLYDHIKEANEFGLELTDLQLTAKGFAPEEIDALKNWRKAWDTHFYLENADLVKTLSNKGYKLFDNGNDRFFAKQVQKNQNITGVYDPDLQQINALNQADLDALYAAGGYYAELRAPIKVGNRNVTHILVRNNPSNYLRGLQASDQVLNYRKGYFQVGYKAPKFIEEIVRGSNGEELYRRAFEMAETSEEAEHVVQRAMTATGRSREDFNVRGDKRDFAPDTDSYWQLQSATGRVAQRLRGKTLEDANAPAGAFSGKYTLDPVESAIRASRSLSGRVASRDMLEAMKIRAMQQYGEFFPPGKFGEKEWVENSNSLVSQGNMTEKRIRDARTTVEYINYLQNGYHNAVDEGFKGVFNMLANTLRDVGLSTGEKYALKAATAGGPTDFLKSAVFQSYIALNPLRQFLIQSHQSLRATAINPTYVLNPLGLSKDSSTYIRHSTGLLKNPSAEEKAIIDFIEQSGMLDAIDKSNLIRGSLTEIAESANPVKRGVGKTLAVPRRIGFDTGEGVNLLSHLLTVRDMFQKQGKNLADKAVRDEAYSMARAITYDMNFAGDMPYNQNAAALVLQFFQVPHKAMLQYTNRRIPGELKARMAALDIALWGVPGALIIDNYFGDVLPEDPKIREAIVFGAESAVMNHTISKLMEKETNIDFSSLAPYQLDGFAHLATAFWAGGLGEVFGKSPAHGLLTKEGSRMRDALGRLARYTGFLDTSEGLEPETATSVLKGFAEVASAGYSNYSKAELILEMGKIRDKKGRVLLEDATWAHATAQLFGFKSQEEVLQYAMLSKANESKKQYVDRIESEYKEYVSILTRQTKLSNTDEEFVVKVLGAMMKKWEGDPEALKIVRKNLQRDVVRNPTMVMRAIREYAKIPGITETTAEIENMRILNNPDYDKALRMNKDIQETLQRDK